MENLEIIKERVSDYIVHYKLDNSKVVAFEVYPITEYEGANGEKGFYYIDKNSGTYDFLNEFKEGQCVKKFEGTFVWRGVWESRIYFTDSEYWGEELKELADLFENNITPWCKEFIKNHPDNKDRYQYFED